MSYSRGGPRRHTAGVWKALAGLGLLRHIRRTGAGGHANDLSSRSAGATALNLNRLAGFTIDL